MSLDIVVFEAAAMIASHAAELPAAKRAETYAEFVAALGRVLNVTPAAAVDTRPAHVVAEVESDKASAKVRGTTQKEAADNQVKVEAERAAELEESVKKVEADAKKGGASGAAETSDTNTGAQSDDEPLDYDKDVKPLLVQVVTKHSKETLAALLQECGLAPGEKGGKLNAKQLVVAKAKAEKLIAAAG